jgi:hypothetical protein
VSPAGPSCRFSSRSRSPDVQLLRHRTVPYKHREAWRDDVLLVVEVAETSLKYDSTPKLRLYAEAGIFA